MDRVPRDTFLIKALCVNKYKIVKGELLKKMYILLSHELTKEQYKDAVKSLNVDTFITLNNSQWSQIPADVEDISPFLEGVQHNVLQTANIDDVILVQGDFGAVYNIVSFCKKRNIKTFYATTKRDVIEYTDKNGKNVKKSVFEFRRFREYE